MLIGIRAETGRVRSLACARTVAYGMGQGFADPMALAEGRRRG